MTFTSTGVGGIFFSVNARMQFGFYISNSYCVKFGHKAQVLNFLKWSGCPQGREESHRVKRRPGTGVNIKSVVIFSSCTQYERKFFKYELPVKG